MSTAPGTALLTVDRLCVTYEQEPVPVRAADRVSFMMMPGEVLALVGESGSGKSSVALALTRLLPSPPAAITGAVRCQGRDLLALSDEEIRHVRGRVIGYVFQDPGASLNPVLPVGEQLIETIELHTEARGDRARRVAAEWLDRVGIAHPTERLAAFPHELSGGMQQRVALAMAIAAEPALLVADEPTSALDVTVQVQILKLLRDLQRSLGLSILLISHDLAVVERLAHRVGVMQQGTLVELGAVAEVMRQPTHPYTRELLHARALLSLDGGAA